MNLMVVQLTPQISYIRYNHNRESIIAINKFLGKTENLIEKPTINGKEVSRQYCWAVKKDNIYTLHKSLSEVVPRVSYLMSVSSYYSNPKGAYKKGRQQARFILKGCLSMVLNIIHSIFVKNLTSFLCLSPDEIVALKKIKGIIDGLIAKYDDTNQTIKEWEDFYLKKP
jgi:hypothetical protein